METQRETGKGERWNEMEGREGSRVKERNGDRERGGEGMKHGRKEGRRWKRRGRRVRDAR